MPSATIATLNLDDFFGNGARKKEFVRQLKESLSTTGFFFLTNHHIPEKVVTRVMKRLPRFFEELPLETRMKYASGDVMGYTPPNVERGEGFSIADEKHFLHMRDGQMPFVEEVPGLNVYLSHLSVNFQLVTRMLLQGVALSLDLPEYHFDPLLKNSLLRALHYPANDHPTEHESDLIEGGNAIGMCAAPHTDINMLTLLLAREPGLELWHEGQWMPITITDSNSLIVNGADMLRHLTGGRYKSGLHRVICKPGVARYSIPYFGHVDPETPLVPLASLGPSDLTEFHHETAGAFLHQRLVELGVIAA
ncbi:MAG: hypothetical protein JWL75_157 [Parcubacteria group bacterium]|nr:hypothetical protein [Parcubacteria group bacterium]